MRFLHEQQFTSMTAEDYYAALMNPAQPIPPRCVLITFDDGHDSDHLVALPILKQYRIKATVFVTTDWIDHPGHLSTSQLHELKAEGVSVQSHAKTHTLLDRLSVDELRIELEVSRMKLEEILGSRVSHLAFPGGRYNQSVIACGIRLGFSGLFSSEPFALDRLDRTFLIGRYNLKRSLRGTVPFERITNPGVLTRSLLRTAYHGKAALKKMLGDRLYQSVWQRYIGKT